MKIIVFAGGELEYTEFYRHLALDADFIICCDSGSNHAHNLDIVPNLIIGDLDSIDNNVLTKFKSLHVEFQVFPPAKDATDLELAIETAKQYNPHEITILGGFGGRVDHLFGNVNVLIAAAISGIKIAMLDLHTKITVIQKTAEIMKEDYEYISLIPLTKAARVTTCGLEYPLYGDTLEMWSTRGISNKFSSDIAAITLESGLLLAICTKVR